MSEAAGDAVGEMLEVYDAGGKPTGVAKSRADVHRDGDWHLAFFCWIVRVEQDREEVILQKRALTKDVWPGRYDASAAGHVRFGETPAEASREIEEELGLQIDPHELQPLMRHPHEHVHENGLVDREIHDVHLLRCDLPLTAYHPGPEVTEVVAAPLRELIELAEGTRETVATSGVTSVTAVTAVTLRRDDLVPYDVAYWRALYSGLASIARR